MLKVKIKSISSISLLLPLGLLLGAIVLDMNVISGLLAADDIRFTREGFIILSMVLSLPIIYKQKWASDRNVLRGLRSLFVLVIFAYLLLLISDLNVIAGQVKTNGSLSLYNSVPGYVVVVAWALFSSIFVLVVLGTLRNLIFIKQKKNTALNFLLLMLAMILYAIMSIFHFDDTVSRFTYGIGNGTVGHVVLFLLINLMVINSFRVSWLNYLNKKQKLATFWGGLILVPIQWLLHFRFHENNPAAVFSPVLGRFVDMGLLFLSIYLSVVFIALIFHLPTAQVYDRKMRQISSLHNLSRAVSSEFNFSKLVETIVRLAREVTEADACWLELMDPGNQNWKLAASYNLTEYDKSHLNHDGQDRLSQWLIQHKEPLLVNHVSKSPFKLPILLWKSDIQSLLAAPLVTTDKLLGCLFVGKRMEFSFEQDDVDTLRAFSEQAVIAIENARLVQESLVKERLEQELRIAHQAQMKLLPKEMPPLDDAALDAVCITANEVGGDYYDFFPLSHSRLGIVVADVSGKGPSAAFIMAELKGIMEAFAQNHSSPKNLLIAANDILFNNLERDTFVSLVYGIFDQSERSFTFCRAGHTPVLLAKENAAEIKTMEPFGMGLGLDNSELFADSLEQVTVQLQNKDTLLFYTDGVIEARNSKGEEYGETRLNQIFLNYHASSIQVLKQKLIDDIKGFVSSVKPHDDLTFVILKMQ
ncbi:SpoIIE family protein phosphatase [candidate division KSB1 bacterium]|nr:SpoIIE family protein phosphatase [candidate division KSB1 bacterium]